MPPLVSIITPSLNMGAYLEETIRSVLAQDYARIEYIVLDAASSDGTAEILARFADRLTAMIEPDEGPADCIRKGLARASGGILMWLSADDVLLPGAVTSAVRELDRHPAAAAVYGDAEWIDASGAAVRRYPTADFDAQALLRECFVCQPACMFRRSAYDACGGMDAALRFTFDWDLWIRMSRAMPFVHVPERWARSRMHANNISLGHKGRVLEESIALLLRHAGYVPVRWVYGWLSQRDAPSDQFFVLPRKSAWRYLRALVIGAKWNRGQLARYAGEWISGLRANRTSAN